MKKIIIVALLLMASLASVGQGINSKAIEITNTDSDEYTQIVGTKIKLKLPSGFTRRNSYTYENSLSESFISVKDLDGDINRNFYTFDKNAMFHAGIVVLKETFFKINGFEAMMIDGEQYIDSKELAVSILLIGNLSQTYLIMGSTPKPIRNNMNIAITNSLLSVIFIPDMEISSEGMFSFSLNTDGTILKEGKPISDSRIYTDDGNVPSKTADMTTLTVKEIASGRQYTDDQQKDICKHRMEQYPISWDETSSLTPQKIKVGEYYGYEIRATGTNKLMRNEFLYQLIIFGDDRYYVITGMSLGDEKECTEMFRKVAGTLRNN